MLVTFTDFGCHGPYLGQMQAVLRRQAPGIEVIDLINNAPATDPGRSAYLLAALAHWWPQDTVFLCVVDPGVGSERLPVALKADGKWFVGPDNGLFNVTALKASSPVSWYQIIWRPGNLSASFHGRDLFAPVAARIARGEEHDWLQSWAGPDLSGWPDDLAEVIYIDHYGNAMTGIAYRDEMAGQGLEVNNQKIGFSTTFSGVPKGSPLWYQNSIGLVEIAVNQGRADDVLRLKIGSRVKMSNYSQPTTS
ncbi:MAG: hypothetical protein AXA67_04575 [Methylothermaceae bacteria B42]|nr:MAG: hypothetical protein AXA67_04575 [Methylothermaceae bacteria B42]HHJ39961.1 hypothetical protein [Methylothermaceae bacterium]